MRRRRHSRSVGSRDEMLAAPSDRDHDGAALDCTDTYRSTTSLLRSTRRGVDTRNAVFLSHRHSIGNCPRGEGGLYRHTKAPEVSSQVGFCRETGCSYSRMDGSGHPFTSKRKLGVAQVTLAAKCDQSTTLAGADREAIFLEISTLALRRWSRRAAWAAWTSLCRRAARMASCSERVSEAR